MECFFPVDVPDIFLAFDDVLQFGGHGLDDCVDHLRLAFFAHAFEVLLAFDAVVEDEDGDEEFE
jgi:hypothetical protein